MKSTNFFHLYLAFAVTLVGASITYFLLGRPTFIGVDDANITQVYAQNIAQGYGYVYTPGHERVEGSTSILWTLINAAAFAITDHPEVLLLVLSFLLTSGVIYESFRIYELLTLPGGVEKSTSVKTLGLFLIGMFGFFAWNVWSLMDSALWAFLLNGLVLSILLQVLGEVRRRDSIIQISLQSGLMVLARPEAMALVPVMLLLGVIGVWKSEARRIAALQVNGAGFFTFFLVAAGLTAFRFTYFGVPFPNTYYAKVSTDLADNLLGGSAYLFKFVIFGPYADAIIIVVISCFMVMAWILWNAELLDVSSEIYSCFFVISGTVLAVLGLPLATGGDHFSAFRLYQPIYPLLFVLVFAVLFAVFRNVPSLNSLSAQLRRFVLSSIWFLFFVSTVIGFFQNRDIRNEFRIAQRGRLTGEALNGVLARLPNTRVAVVAAGGIAFTYKGRVIDLMGLNWPSMAHATGRRTGPQGHSAFDAGVFWTEFPELIVPRLEHRPLQKISMKKLSVQAVNALIRSPKFRKSYASVVIPISDRYIVTYARRDWVQTYAQSNRIYKIK